MARFWNNPKHWPWLRLAVAILAVLVAAGVRIELLGSLAQRVPWLTFYPAAIVAALCGGFAAGLLPPLAPCLTIVFLWPLFGSLARHLGDRCRRAQVAARDPVLGSALAFRVEHLQYTEVFASLQAGAKEVEP